MKCRVRNESLSAFLDGELDGVEERRLRDHLGICEACRAELGAMRRVSAALRASEAQTSETGPGFTPRDSFVKRVVRTAKSAPARRKPVHRLRRGQSFSPSPLAAAAVLLLFVGVSAALFFGATSREPFTAPDVIGDLPSAGDPLTGLPAGWRDAPELAEARLQPPVDLGPPLPPVPTERAELSGEDLFLALGLKKVGDRWMSPEAYGRFREHRDREAALARAKKRNEARPELPLQPGPDNGHSVGIEGCLAALEFGDPAVSDELTLYPLRTKKPARDIQAFGLEEGLAKRLLLIKEEQSTATIFAKNRDGSRFAFLAAGEILVGGHQDRIITRDTLIPPGWLAQLPVLCCEQRRSTGTTPRFATSPGIAPAGIRGLLLAARSQDDVWKRIASDLREFGAQNPTRALRGLYQASDWDALQAKVGKLLKDVSGSDVVGFLAVADGKILGAEVFTSPALFRTQAHRFAVSYLLESLRESPAAAQSLPPAKQLKALLGQVAKARFFPGHAGTTGRESEFDGGDGQLSGYAISPARGGGPVHVSLYVGLRPQAGGVVNPARTRTGTSDGAPPPDLPQGTPGAGSTGSERRRHERQKGQGIPQEERVPGTVNPPRREPPRSTPNTPRDPNDVPKVPDRSVRR